MTEWPALLAYMLMAWMAALSVCDIREQRLPDTLTLPGAVVVLVAACSAGRGWPAIAGAVALTALYLVVHLVSPTALGAGDVKLALGLGALTGWFGTDVWLLAALVAPLLTGVCGIVVWVGRGRHAVPHGPSMCMASAVSVLLAVVG